MKKIKENVFVSVMCLLVVGMAVFVVVSSVGAATEKSITLACTVHYPPPAPPPAKIYAEHLILMHWAKEMEARTEGRVKVKYHYGAVLGKPTDFLRMVGGEGVADMGVIVGVFHQWELPLFAGIHQPFLTTGVETPMKASRRLYQEWAPMREEWTKHNVKPLWWYVTDPYFMAIGKQISTLDDIKGLKIYGPGSFAGILKRFGAVPTFITGPEAYEALQRGVLDGLLFPFSPIKSFRFYEIRKVFVDFTFAGSQAAIATAINQDVWNKISPKDRKALEELSAEMPAHYGRYFHETEEDVTKYFKSKGVTFIRLSPEEESRVKERCAQEMWSEWIKLAEQKGVPAKEFLDRYKAIVKELTQ